MVQKKPHLSCCWTKTNCSKCSTRYLNNIIKLINNSWRKLKRNTCLISVCVHWYRMVPVYATFFQFFKLLTFIFPNVIWKHAFLRSFDKKFAIFVALLHQCTQILVQSTRECMDWYRTATDIVNILRIFAVLDGGHLLAKSNLIVSLGLRVRLLLHFAVGICCQHWPCTEDLWVKLSENNVHYFGILKTESNLSTWVKLSSLMLIYKNSNNLL